MPNPPPGPPRSGVLRPRRTGVANRPLGRRRRPGEGSVYLLADGRWRAAIEVRDADGRRRQVTARAATREEAMERLRAIIRRLHGE